MMIELDSLSEWLSSNHPPEEQEDDPNEEYRKFLASFASGGTYFVACEVKHRMQYLLWHVSNG